MITGKPVVVWTLVVLAAAGACRQIDAADADDASMRRDFVAPENRAGKFQQPDAYFPHRSAMPGNDVLLLPHAAIKESFDVAYEWQGNTYSIDDFNDRTQTNALLILKDGQIVTEIYRNGAQPESRFISWSTGKSNGQQVVAKEWVRSATSIDRKAVDYGKLYDGYPLGYGYQ